MTEARAFDSSGLDELIATLAVDRIVYGPTLRDGVIRYGRVTSTADLPRGWTDQQAPGAYSTTYDAGSGGLFGYAVGPDSLKGRFHPASETVLTAERRDGSIVFTQSDPDATPIAVIGVRPCELAAGRIQDTVLREGPFADLGYAIRRDAAFLVAVECGVPAATCFCTSMGTGPGATGGFDLALTEIATADGFRYLCRAGSERGEAVLDRLSAPVAAEAVVAEAERVVAEAAASMAVRLDPEAARDLLAANPEADVWNAIESRCLACTNCTLVCPTCFCTTVTETTDLAAETWSRTKVWDSCFSLEFSALHRHPVRASIGSRYRQWLTHKLSTWYDQFGSSGCVGCGRCITWCPVGIDLVEEVHRLEAEVAT